MIKFRNTSLGFGTLRFSIKFIYIVALINDTQTILSSLKVIKFKEIMCLNLIVESNILYRNFTLRKKEKVSI